MGSKVCEYLNIASNVKPRLRGVLARTIAHYRMGNLDLTRALAHLTEPLKELSAIFDSYETSSSSQSRSIILCVECNKRSAFFKCDQCLDEFCDHCFQDIHSTGNRRFHSCTQIPQLVCMICDIMSATVQCIQCTLFFCEACFSCVHAKRPELVKHRKRHVAGLLCQECEESRATLVCQNCVDIFCASCFMIIHGRGNRRSHTCLSIDNAGYMYRSDGTLVNRSETLDLLDRTRTVSGKTAILSPNESSISYSYSHCFYRKVALIDSHTLGASVQVGLGLVPWCVRPSHAQVLQQLSSCLHLSL